MSRRHPEVIAITEELNDAKIPYTTEIGKHCKITFELGGRKHMLVAALSPSDHRATLNARARTKRLIRQFA